MNKTEDTYELTDTIVNDNDQYSCTIRVFSPVISDQEREKRMDEFKKATAVYMAEVYKERMQREAQEREAIV
jgi:hypothetical protein